MDSVSVKQFADKYRVKVQRDTCNDAVIFGKQFCKDMLDEYRSHVFDCEDGKHFGVCLMFSSPKKWGHARRKLEAVKFTICQNGDTEGIGLFNPDNKQQAKLALKLAGVKTRRELPPERREALIQTLAAARAARQAQILAPNTV